MARYRGQVEVAQQIKTLFASTNDVVDVDWLVEDDQTEYQFNVDKEKAMLAGVSTQQVVHTLHMALQK